MVGKFNITESAFFMVFISIFAYVLTYFFIHHNMIITCFIFAYFHVSNRVLILPSSNVPPFSIDTFYQTIYDFEYNRSGQTPLFKMSDEIMMTSSNGEKFALLAFCEGNPPVTGGFPSQKPVTQSFDFFLPEQTAEQVIKTLVIWDAIALIMTSLQWYCRKRNIGLS